jgi:hypothetical protein
MRAMSGLIQKLLEQNETPETMIEAGLFTEAEKDFFTEIGILSWD